MSIAAKLHPADAEAEDVIETGVWYDHGTDFGGHTTSRGRVYGVLPIRYDGCERYGCNKVIVIDPWKVIENPPKDADTYLARLLREAAENNGIPSFDRLADVFDPTPPIEEPKGLGAVVEAIHKNRFIRVGEAGWVHECDPAGEPVAWEDIAVIRVLSEGVPAEVSK